LLSCRKSINEKVLETPMTFIIGAWAEDQLGLEATFVDSRALELSGRFVYQIAGKMASFSTVCWELQHSPL
jgi:hypothetical protein